MRLTIHTCDIITILSYCSAKIWTHTIWGICYNPRSLYCYALSAAGADPRGDVAVFHEHHSWFKNSDWSRNCFYSTFRAHVNRNMRLLKVIVNKWRRSHIVQVEAPGASSGMGVAMVASHRIAVVPNRSGLLIIRIHGSHERAPSDRPATTFHTIVLTDPFRPRHFCLFTPINHHNLHNTTFI